MIEANVFPARAQSALTSFRKLVEESVQAAAGLPLHKILRDVLGRAGYWGMIEESTAPDAETRLENLQELLNAAAEAAERGEGIAEFLDHAALVSDSDQLDERAEVSLLTLHNAKGLEFPVVFIAGMEERLCPHSRSVESDAMIEEERRLCYVGMTRAERRLILTWARSRRRFGGGSLEPSQPSRFLTEIPRNLTENLGVRVSVPQVDLFLEQQQVREAVARTAYTGKTYNSLDHIQQFFAARGGAQPAQTVGAEAPRVEVPKPLAAKPKRKKGAEAGSVVTHPVYGRGTVLRREGEGEEAKLTVMFPGYGLKKLALKYAGLKTDE
jgi:DNA helicase-2/ATP-dependent DNA helicase PcrA